MCLRKSVFTCDWKWSCPFPPPQLLLTRWHTNLIRGQSSINDQSQELIWEIPLPVAMSSLSEWIRGQELSVSPSWLENNIIKLQAMGVKDNVWYLSLYSTLSSSILLLVDEPMGKKSEEMLTPAPPIMPELPDMMPPGPARLLLNDPGSPPGPIAALMLSWMAVWRRGGEEGKSCGMEGAPSPTASISGGGEPLWGRRGPTILGGDPPPSATGSTPPPPSWGIARFTASMRTQFASSRWWRAMPKSSIPVHACKPCLWEAVFEQFVWLCFASDWHITKFPKVRHQTKADSCSGPQEGNMIHLEKGDTGIR